MSSCPRRGSGQAGKRRARAVQKKRELGRSSRVRVRREMRAKWASPASPLPSTRPGWRPCSSRWGRACGRRRRCGPR
eukprot:scaffold4745_cov125-Isochrysis_galbana.AAC.3